MIIINEHYNFLFAIFKIVSIGFEGFNNSQKLTIICFITSLYKNYFTQIVDYWMPLAQIVYNQPTQN